MTDNHAGASVGPRLLRRCSMVTLLCALPSTSQAESGLAAMGTLMFGLLAGIALFVLGAAAATASIFLPKGTSALLSRLGIALVLLPNLLLLYWGQWMPAMSMWAHMQFLSVGDLALAFIPLAATLWVIVAPGLTHAWRACRDPRTGRVRGRRLALLGSGLLLLGLFLPFSKIHLGADRFLRVPFMPWTPLAVLAVASLALSVRRWLPWLMLTGTAAGGLVIHGAISAVLTEGRFLQGHLPLELGLFVLLAGAALVSISGLSNVLPQTRTCQVCGAPTGRTGCPRCRTSGLRVPSAAAAN